MYIKADRMIIRDLKTADGIFFPKWLQMEVSLKFGLTERGRIGWRNG